MSDEGRLLARLRQRAASPPSCTARWSSWRRKLDIELVELDRANCCGAGVIAEHNQELVDTPQRAHLRAWPRRWTGPSCMMNICSTCQGAQSECQERLDANAEATAST